MRHPRQPPWRTPGEACELVSLHKREVLGVTGEKKVNPVGPGARIGKKPYGNGPIRVISVNITLRIRGIGMSANPAGLGYFFEDLEVGMSADLMKTVMSNDVIGFAQLSGDTNPVHLSDHFAARTPFRGRIAHGLYTASLISALLGTRSRPRRHLPGAEPSFPRAGAHR